MAINFTSLKAEIQNDPNAYGYAAAVAAGSDVGVADLLNLVRDGVTAPGAVIQVKRADVTSGELLENIDTRDFKASPTNLESAYLNALLTQRAVRLINDDGSNTRVIGNIGRIVSGNANGSQTRLTAVAQRNGSRAEQLFGTGAYVQPEDVARALRG